MPGRLGDRNVSPTPKIAMPETSAAVATARLDVWPAASTTSHAAPNTRPVTATARVRRQPRTSRMVGSCATTIAQVLAANANPTTLRLTSAGPVAQAGNADVIWL